jgi:hypothetical protein
MPCNSIAVVRARLESRVVDELLAAPQTVSILEAWLRQQLGAVATRVPTADGLRLAAAGIVVDLSRSAGLSVTGPDRSAVERLAPAAEALARDIAAALAQERLVAALRARAFVAGDERAPSGHRVLTIAL